MLCKFELWTGFVFPLWGCSWFLGVLSNSALSLSLPLFNCLSIHDLTAHLVLCPAMFLDCSCFFGHLALLWKQRGSDTSFYPICNCLFVWIHTECYHYKVTRLSSFVFVFPIVPSSKLILLLITAVLYLRKELLWHTTRKSQGTWSKSISRKIQRD